MEANHQPTDPTGTTTAGHSPSKTDLEARIVADARYPAFRAEAMRVLAHSWETWRDTDWSKHELSGKYIISSLHALLKKQLY
jgi:hypothetical protein